MLTFELVTLDGLKVSEECYELLIPTPLGQIGVFENHMPLVSILSPGVVSMRRRQADPDDKLEHYATAGGMIEVSGRRVRLLADEAEDADDLNEMEVKAALDRAKQLQRSAKSRVAQADAAAMIERHVGQLRVAELKKRRQKR